jgi:hypothetical protein
MRAEGWCVYCDAVAGVNHVAEARVVMRSGAKLAKELAVVLFPNMEGPYIE